jgi:hypothetical protein
MNKDQGIGLVVLVASVVGIVLYAWLIYAFTILILQITAFIAVAGILGIAAWIGWTMATTPPPAPLEPEGRGLSVHTGEPLDTGEPNGAAADERDEEVTGSWLAHSPERT